LECRQACNFKVRFKNIKCFFAHLHENPKTITFAYILFGDAKAFAQKEDFGVAMMCLAFASPTRVQNPRWVGALVKFRIRSLKT
jgi:hypothetical protein